MEKPRMIRQIVLRTAPMTLVFGGLLFGTAGTWAYWPAWVYLTIFFALSLGISFYLLAHDPELLARRMKTHEKEKVQKVGQIVALTMLIAVYAFCGFDYRYGWSSVPTAVVLISNALVALGFVICFLVLLANRFAATTIEVEPGQTVISTGPYARVRHPMYVGGLLVLLPTPLALGSSWAMLSAVPFIAWLVVRILNEEKVLLRDLPGYADYCQKVPWRLVPGIW